MIPFANGLAFSSLFCCLFSCFIVNIWYNFIRIPTIVYMYTRRGAAQQKAVDKSSHVVSSRFASGAVSNARALRYAQRPYCWQPLAARILMCSAVLFRCVTWVSQRYARTVDIKNYFINCDERCVCHPIGTCNHLKKIFRLRVCVALLLALLWLLILPSPHPPLSLSLSVCCPGVVRLCRQSLDRWYKKWIMTGSRGSNWYR